MKDLENPPDDIPVNGRDLVTGIPKQVFVSYQEVAEALEQLRAMWHGHRIAVHVTDHSPGPGIDTPQDLERVRLLVAR